MSCRCCLSVADHLLLLYDEDTRIVASFYIQDENALDASDPFALRRGRTLSMSASHTCVLADGVSSHLLVAAFVHCETIEMYTACVAYCSDDMLWLVMYNQSTTCFSPLGSLPLADLPTVPTTANCFLLAGPLLCIMHSDSGRIFLLRSNDVSVSALLALSVLSMHPSPSFCHLGSIGSQPFYLSVETSTPSSSLTDSPLPVSTVYRWACHALIESDQSRIERLIHFLPSTLASAAVCLCIPPHLDSSWNYIDSDPTGMFLLLGLNTNQVAICFLNRPYITVELNSLPNRVHLLSNSDMSNWIVAEANGSVTVYPVSCQFEVMGEPLSYSEIHQTLLSDSTPAGADSLILFTESVLNQPSAKSLHCIIAEPIILVTSESAGEPMGVAEDSLLKIDSSLKERFKEGEARLARLRENHDLTKVLIQHTNSLLGSTIRSSEPRGDSCYNRFTSGLIPLWHSSADIDSAVKSDNRPSLHKPLFLATKQMRNGFLSDGSLVVSVLIHNESDLSVYALNLVVLADSGVNLFTRCRTIPELTSNTAQELSVQVRLDSWLIHPEMELRFVLSFSLEAMHDSTPNSLHSSEIGSIRVSMKDFVVSEQSVPPIHCQFTTSIHVESIQTNLSFIKDLLQALFRLTPVHTDLSPAPPSTVFANERFICRFMFDSVHEVCMTIESSDATSLLFMVKLMQKHVPSDVRISTNQFTSSSVNQLMMCTESLLSEVKRVQRFVSQIKIQQATQKDTRNSNQLLVQDLLNLELTTDELLSAVLDQSSL
eukprot:GILK01008948.1.p1 GENE.GILK01008948.1~~GILK01008948.1.p1  ORF type:complete len:770 (+),score=144.54 GILK01008948.1:74-2383(+)